MVDEVEEVEGEETGGGTLMDGGTLECDGNSVVEGEVVAKDWVNIEDVASTVELVVDTLEDCTAEGKLVVDGEVVANDRMDVSSTVELVVDELKGSEADGEGLTIKYEVAILVSMDSSVTVTVFVASDSTVDTTVCVTGGTVIVSVVSTVVTAVAWAACDEDAASPEPPSTGTTEYLGPLRAI